MKYSMEKTFQKIISIFFLIVFLFVIINNTFYSHFEYYCKVTTDLSSKGIFISAVVFIALVILFYFLIKQLDIHFNHKRIFLIVLFFFFIFQIILLKNIFFLTGWDSNIILTDSYLLRDFKIDQLNQYYYSLYPNNILVTYIFATVMKLEKFIGILDYRYAVFGLTIVQSILCTITAYLLFHIIYDLKKSFAIAWFGFGIYVVLIVFSGWTGIAYSDSMGLIFPTLILWIYLNRYRFNKYIVWTLIVLLSYWGYRIKPQIFIVFIAIVIIELIKFILRPEKLKKLKSNFGVISLVIVVSLVSSFTYKHLPERMGYKIDPNLETPIYHFLMMGFNEEANGGYNVYDVKYTLSYYGVKEKKDAILIRLSDRLQQYGPKRVAKIMQKKALSIFNDGTFAWGFEGGFYREVVPTDNKLSLFLRSFVYNGDYEMEVGNHYHIIKTTQQTIWTACLLLMVIKAISLKKNDEDDHSVMYLSLLGLFLFEMLFEARARYLYTYIPVFIMVGSLGLFDLIDFINQSIAQMTSLQQNSFKLKNTGDINWSGKQDYEEYARKI